MISIEEKAKAYDEALSVAQETYITQPMYREWLAKMFPELKEPKDERIRKMIINHLTQERGSLSNDEAAEAIDWFKSLKDRYIWKPTKAQIASLTIACDRNDRIGFDLTQLLRDLKKLKEG